MWWGDIADGRMMVWCGGKVDVGNTMWGRTVLGSSMLEGDVIFGCDRRYVYGLVRLWNDKAVDL